MMTFEEFRALAREGNVVPLFEQLLVDTETPVSVYLKVRDTSPYSFLLESVEGGERIGRYSFIGYNPFMTFTIREHSFFIDTFHDDVVALPKQVHPDDRPLDALKKLFNHLRPVRIAGLPRLTGGAVGYFGYESVRLIEDISKADVDELAIPDAILMFFDVVLVFDNLKHEVSLISNAYCSSPELCEADLRKEYEKAASEIERMKDLLVHQKAPEVGRAQTNGALEYVLSKEAFCKKVERSKHYIVEGDIFQVVLSQRLRQKAVVDHFDLYRSLRLVNPSPYMYYLRMKDFSVIGSSPEMLVRVEGGVVETRPIAGTRRRGSNEEEDRTLQEELLNDPKERAEHLMLVDLGRNDIGRISEYGSVRIPEFMVIERYSHVMHIVSSVRGKLQRGLSPIDALFSCFPAGTLTGAPKIRAMQIIAELEPVTRGVYGGAIAYIDFSGNIDSCIAIRTIIAKDDVLYFQAGAGIVADSVPEREYEETMEKLSANLKALQLLTQPISTR